MFCAGMIIGAVFTFVALVIGAFVIMIITDKILDFKETKSNDAKQ